MMKLCLHMVPEDDVRLASNSRSPRRPPITTFRTNSGASTRCGGTEPSGCATSRARKTRQLRAHLGQHDVARLEVSMDDAHPVRLAAGTERRQDFIRTRVRSAR